jgi:hypothetical protein
MYENREIPAAPAERPGKAVGGTVGKGLWP